MKKSVIAVILTMLSLMVVARPGPSGHPGPRPGPRPGPYCPLPGPRVHHAPPPPHHDSWIGSTIIGSAIIGSAIVNATTPKTVVVQQPAVVQQPIVTTPVVVKQPVQVWVEGRYVDQVQPNGAVVRIWQPGHYEWH